jgi:hypothetical protein
MLPEGVPTVIPITPTRTLPDATAFPEAAPPPPDAPPAAEAPPAPGLPGKRTLAAPAARVLALLRDPRSLAAAVLLREVFEPPLCRRGPRRPDRHS